MDGVKTPRQCQRPKMSPHVSSWKIAAQNYPDVELISIHAPAWGATTIRPQLLRDIIISIHAPAWGATVSTWEPSRICLISIHAPAWGATVNRMELRLNVMISIHAPAWGATRSLRSTSSPLRFQSTRPRGARRNRGAMCRTPRHFNPRARVGRDTLLARQFVYRGIFQSTRPRGARLCLFTRA